MRVLLDECVDGRRAWARLVQARAKVRIAIEDALDEGLPRAYTRELFKVKSDSLFEHVYESYLGDGASLYSMGA